MQGIKAPPRCLLFPLISPHDAPASSRSPHFHFRAPRKHRAPSGTRPREALEHALSPTATGEVLLFHRIKPTLLAAPFISQARRGSHPALQPRRRNLCVGNVHCARTAAGYSLRERSSVLRGGNPSLFFTLGCRAHLSAPFLPWSTTADVLTAPLHVLAATFRGQRAAFTIRREDCGVLSSRGEDNCLWRVFLPLLARTCAGSSAAPRRHLR